jgi:hypothetical protein
MSMCEEPMMKHVVILALLAVLLGGCVVAPAGYRYRDGDNDRHYRYERGYGRGYGYGYGGYGYRDREHGS